MQQIPQTPQIPSSKSGDKQTKHIMMFDTPQTGDDITFTAKEK